MNNKLRTCDDCGGKVSKRAATCPHCGAPQEILNDVEEEISIKEQDLIDEKHPNTWEEILSKDRNKPKNHSGNTQKSRNQSFVYSILFKKIIWKFNLLTLTILVLFLIVTFTTSIKFLLERKINQNYLADSEKIDLVIDKHIDAKNYDKALNIINYYQGNYFHEESLNKKKEFAEKRMKVYDFFVKEYKDISILDKWNTIRACEFLKRNHSKGFLEKEFLNTQINLQKKAINDLKIENKLLLVKKSYIYLNSISNNAYLNEYNLWNIKNGKKLEKARKENEKVREESEKKLEKARERDKIMADQCKRTGIIQSALKNANYPISNIPYADYCARRKSGSIGVSVSEMAPSKINPCSYFADNID